MNYENPYNHVTKSDRNHRVIKKRFQIEYYRLLYKNIPRIMIHHFVINVTQNLNLPAKEGVLNHYIPHMIPSQSIWDYNKHRQVEFDAYVNI